MLDATYEVGLSGPSRLHDLFVTHEAMTPGDFKSGGAGVTMSFGFHPSPFGEAILVATERGLAGLGFVDDGDREAAEPDLPQPWSVVSDTTLVQLTIGQLLNLGIDAAATQVIERLETRRLDRVWLHVDLDVLAC